MQLVPKDKFFKNPSTDHQIPLEIQKKLLSGNAQFIIDLAQHIKLNSYQITSQAIYLCNYFFYKRSYLEYDRFIVASSALMLAGKMRDTDLRIKTIVFAYHKLVSQIYENQNPMNDQIFQVLKDKFCIAEAQLLRTMCFNFNVQLPKNFLFKRQILYSENVYYTSKIILFDMYRTQVVFSYTPHVLAVAAFILVLGYFDQDLLTPDIKSALSEKQDDQEKLEAFQNWMEKINKLFETTIPIQEVINCIQDNNEFLEFIRAIQ